LGGGRRAFGRRDESKKVSLKDGIDVLVKFHH
jgi:hypothetical protein